MSVDELTLWARHNGFPNESLLISDTLWMFLNPRLRKLNYKGNLETLQRILSPPPRYNFDPPSSLTHLVMYFQVEWWAIPIANISVFVEFLQCLEQTLESLSLRMPGSFTYILLKLPHFPRLQNLDFHLNPGQIIPEEGIAFTSFLSAHREYLKTLTLCLDEALSSPVQIYQDFCNISFPFLHTLVLDISQEFVDRIQAFPHVPCLQRFVLGCPYISREMMMTIRERAFPSQPTIALGGDGFKFDVYLQLRRW